MTTSKTKQSSEKETPKKETKSEEKQETLKPNQRQKILKKNLPEGAFSIQCQFDVTYLGTKMVVKDGKSMTQPDMSITIGQLIQNHTRGQEVPTREPVFFNIEVPTFNDITDVEEYQQQLIEQSKKVDQFIKDEKTEAAKKTKEKQAANPNPKPENTEENKQKEPPTKPTDNI